MEQKLKNFWLTAGKRKHKNPMKKKKPTENCTNLQKKHLQLQGIHCCQGVCHLSFTANSKNLWAVGFYFSSFFFFLMLQRWGSNTVDREPTSRVKNMKWRLSNCQTSCNTGYLKHYYREDWIWNGENLSARVKKHWTFRYIHSMHESKFEQHIPIYESMSSSQ